MLKGITDFFGITNSSKTDQLSRNATKEQRAILARLDAIGLPDEEKLKVILQTPELAGLLEAEQLGDTALGDIRTDSQLDANMMEALAGLKERSQTGLTEQDKFAMEELLNQVGAQEQSQRKAIEQDMARQGMGDSGAALTAKLQGSQGGANQARQRAMQMAAMGQDQRMAALQNLGATSSQMQQAQFGQQAQVGSARDQIAQFNAQNRQGVNSQNLATQQNLANQRANIANQQSFYNAGLEQQRFQNEMQKAGAMSGAQQNLAGMYGQQAAANAQADAATTGALIKGGASILAAPASDKDVKVNIEDGSNGVRKMLDMLKPYEYDYKPEAIEDSGDIGRQLGVMAQDLEKSDLGSEFVAEDPNGVKRVDYGKMASTQMAGLADVNNRVSKMEQLLQRLGINIDEIE